MSKMGNLIQEIQDLAYQGLPNAEIAKYTDMPVSFVDDVVKNFFDPDEYEEYVDFEITG